MAPFEGCMPMGAKVSAARTPSQGSGSWGSRQRNSPTGGFAKGMPAKTSTAPSAV